MHRIVIYPVNDVIHPLNNSGVDLFITNVFKTLLFLDRYMYWAEGARRFNNPKIERADMDGKNRKVIITVSSFFFRTPNGLALDTQHNRLYYVVGGSNVISFVSLGTGTRSTLLTRPFNNYPKGVAIHANYIYWTEERVQSGAVYRADRASGGNVKKVVDNLRGPEDICVYNANDTAQIGTCGWIRKKWMKLNKCCKLFRQD